MTAGRWGVASVVVVALAAAVISAGAVIVRLASPSSGTVVGTTGRSFTSDGVFVDVLPGARTVLQGGDLVTTMDGRSTASWADGWLISQGDRSIRVGDLVRFDIERQGGSHAIDVTTVVYPAWDVLWRAVGTLAFVPAITANSGSNPRSRRFSTC